MGHKKKTTKQPYLKKKFQDLLLVNYLSPLSSLPTDTTVTNLTKNMRTESILKNFISCSHSAS